MGAEGTGGTPQTTVSLDTGGRFIEEGFHHARSAWLSIIQARSGRRLVSRAAGREGAMTPSNWQNLSSGDGPIVPPESSASATRRFSILSRPRCGAGVGQGPPLLAGPDCLATASEGAPAGLRRVGAGPRRSARYGGGTNEDRSVASFRLAYQFSTPTLIPVRAGDSRRSCISVTHRPWSGRPGTGENGGVARPTPALRGAASP